MNAVRKAPKEQLMQILQQLAPAATILPMMLAKI